MKFDIQVTPHPRNLGALLGNNTHRAQCKGWGYASLLIWLISISLVGDAQAATSETLDFDFDTSADAQRRLLLISEPIYPGKGYLSFGAQSQSNLGLLSVVDEASGTSLRAPLGFQHILTLWAQYQLPLDLVAGLKLPGIILQSGGPIGQDLAGPSASALSELELNLGHRLKLPDLAIQEHVFPLTLHSQAKLSSGGFSADAYAGSPTPEFGLESIALTNWGSVNPYLGIAMGFRGSTETQGVRQASFSQILVGAVHSLTESLKVGGELESRFDTFIGNPRAIWRATAIWEEPSTGTWTFGVGSGLHAAPGNPALMLHAGWSGGVDSFTDRDNDRHLAMMDACPDEAEDFDGFEDADGCPEPDNDGDGVPDETDACPLEPEDLDGIADEDGCYEEDADEDTFPDVEDACPLKAEDFDKFQDEDGCPEPDNDEDGFPDADDQCPLDAEDIDEFQDQDGCPEPDNDEDGVLDAEDECPNAEGPADGEPAGCPLEETIQVSEDKVTVETVEGKEELTDVVFFAYGRIHLKRSARPILNQIVKLLERDATIEKLRIIGHTDSSGTEDANLKLSQWRADAVRAYLLKRGISPSRVEAVGVGSDSPVASNASKEGRIKNRRVEFILLRTTKAKANESQTSDDSMKSIVDGFLKDSTD